MVATAQGAQPLILDVACGTHARQGAVALPPPLVVVPSALCRRVARTIDKFETKTS